jgi:predicted amidophosphoribosyltransferase
MKRSFIVGNEKLVRGRRIVLVDDVVTTGATLESAAAVLKAAGAKRVEAIVFARA